MSISKASLSNIPTCYATVSIGTPHHDLRQKLEAIAATGFQGIELGFPDLLSFTSKHHKKDVQPQDFDALCAAGEQVRSLCDQLGIKIVMLQPFANFEGWKSESKEREDAFRRAKGWIRIMKAVGTDMLQVSAKKLLTDMLGAPADWCYRLVPLIPQTLIARLKYCPPI